MLGLWIQVLCLQEDTHFTKLWRSLIFGPATNGREKPLSRQRPSSVCNVTVSGMVLLNDDGG